MCQSTVYLRKDGKDQELLRDATRVEPCPDGVRIQGLFDAPRVVPARIAVIDLLKNSIILEPRE